MRLPRLQSPAPPLPDSDHCYAIAEASGGENYGGYGVLYYSCLHMPNNGGFVDNEMWDVSDNGDYWTEIGVKSGTSYGGSYYSGWEWFWADSRPNGGGYNEHEFSSASGGELQVETAWATDNTWDLFGGNSFDQVGTSTNQPLSSSGTSEFGTEYTAGSGSGIRNIGNVSSDEWENTSGGWQFEGDFASAVEAGPGAYITPNYDPSDSDVSWEGPC